MLGAVSPGWEAFFVYGGLFAGLLGGAGAATPWLRRRFRWEASGVKLAVLRIVWLVGMLLVGILSFRLGGRLVDRSDPQSPGFTGYGLVFWSAGWFFVGWAFRPPPIRTLDDADSAEAGSPEDAR
jgi:hypothetical protein